jgi:phosphopantothenoylcysteine synthetase/decarboxylase
MKNNIYHVHKHQNPEIYKNHQLQCNCRVEKKYVEVIMKQHQTEKSGRII